MNVLFVSSGNAAGYYHGDLSPQVKGPGESLKKIGINVTYYLIKGKGASGYLKSSMKLYHYMKKYGKNFDIIHAHNGSIGIIAFFADFHKHKIVVSYLGSDLIGFVDENNQYNILGKLFSLVHRLFSKYFFDFSIVKAKKMLNYLRGVTNVEVIPNGVDFDKFYPVDQLKAKAHLNIPNEIILIIFVANPKTGCKNFKLAQESTSLLKNKKILFMPVYGKTQEELNLFYNAASLMLLTSFHEGSPNVVKEAMACNCPIVSTDVGDVCELIGNTEGCFIADFNPYDFARKIEQVISPGKRTKGRQDIAHLKDGLVAQKLKSIYFSLS